MSEIARNGAAGMAWWNALSESDRRYWLTLANSATPAHAWHWFCIVREDEAVLFA